MAEISLDPMEKFKPIEMENSLIDSIQELFSLDNIEAKTRIRKPSAIAGLKTFADNLEDIGLTRSSKTLLKLIRYRLELNISAGEGKGREEYVDALKSVNQSMNPELTMSEKMFTNLKE